jgi:hypothetical protein
LFFYFDPEVLPGFLYGFPSHFRIRAESLPLDERHLPVTQVVEVFHRQARSSRVVEHNVSHSRNISMAGNRHTWHVHRTRKRRIHGDQPLHRALLEQQRVLLNEFAAVPVAHHEIEVPFLQKQVLDSGHHQRRVALANLGNHDSNREAPLLPKRSRQMVGAVVQLPRRSPNQFLRALRDRFRGRGAVDDEGNRRLRKAQVLRKMLQAHARAGRFPAHRISTQFLSRHRERCGP